MKWLVMITQENNGKRDWTSRVRDFQAGTTRGDVFNWVCKESGMPRGSIVTFFYAEPNEVTA